jgi:glucan phosphoethanolaminetransferase (alkaline phosphatase superfamily)
MKLINNQLKNKLCFIKSRQFFHICFIFVFSILLVIDDQLYQFFNDGNKVVFFSKWTLLAIGVSTILSLSNKKVIYIFLSLFAFLDITQLAYFAYFGLYLDPTQIPFIFLEAGEIALTGFSEFYKTYYAFLVVIIPYSILIYLLQKYDSKLYKIKFIWLLLIIALCYFPRRAYQANNINPLLTRFERPSLYNGLQIYSAYFFNILPRQNNFKEEHFEPYKVEKFQKREKVNIIIVYGESFNWHNINEKTMPNLTKLAKENENFIMKEGISGATFTNTSIPMFFNMQKEPTNYKVQIEKRTNLFTFAKEQGFNTLFISMQSSGTTNSIGAKNIDTLIGYDDEKSLIKENEDDALLEIFKRYDLTDGNNFVVLHQRNLHSPYKANYKHRLKEFDKFDNEYDNCLLFEDNLLNNLINEISNIKTTTYLFITSDHGELTGQGGKWGHGVLDIGCTDIPMMLYTNDKDKTILNNFKAMWKPHHWDILKLITKILGYKVTNPNTPENIYYINNTDVMGRNGYIKVKKDEKNKEIEYEIIK